MDNSIEPAVSNWYQRLTDDHVFQVVAVDEEEALVELQHFDGDIEEVSLGEWHEMDLEAVDPPEDWSGAMDGVRADDAGFSEARSDAEHRGRMQERRRRSLQYADEAPAEQRVESRPPEQAADDPADGRSTGERNRERIGRPGIPEPPAGTDVRERLQHLDRALRSDVERELRKYEDDNYDGLADRVADTGEQSLSDLLSDLNLAEVQRDIEELREVASALRRLDQGHYGICVDCGRPVPAARLEVRPHAARCLDCQRALETGDRKLALRTL